MKLKAYIIERTAPDENRNEWGMVCMTELMEDGTWICGVNIITSIEYVVEKSVKEKVPIWTREYYESSKIYETKL